MRLAFDVETEVLPWVTPLEDPVPGRYYWRQNRWVPWTQVKKVRGRHGDGTYDTPDDIVAVQLAGFACGAICLWQEAYYTRVFSHTELDSFLHHLTEATLLVGANPSFDFLVLSHYADVSSLFRKTVDILKWARFGMWLKWVWFAKQKNHSLEALGIRQRSGAIEYSGAVVNLTGANLHALGLQNLGVGKSHSIKQLRWPEDRQEIEMYCAHDTLLTAQLYALGWQRGWLTVGGLDAPVPFRELEQIDDKSFNRDTLRQLEETWDNPVVKELAEWGLRLSALYVAYEGVERAYFSKRGRQ